MILPNPLTLPAGKEPTPEIQPLLQLPIHLPTLDWEITRPDPLQITGSRNDQPLVQVTTTTLYYKPTHETFNITDPNDLLGTLSWIKSDVDTRPDAIPHDAPPVMYNIAKIIRSGHPQTADPKRWKYNQNGPVTQLLVLIQTQPPVTIVASTNRDATALYVSIPEDLKGGAANIAHERITIRNDDPTALLGWISLTRQYLDGNQPNTPTTPPTFYKVTTRRISLIHAPTDASRRLVAGTIVRWNPTTLTLTPLEPHAETGLKISHYVEREAITVGEANDFLQYTKGTNPAFEPTETPNVIKPMTFSNPKDDKPLYPLGSPKTPRI